MAELTTTHAARAAASAIPLNDLSTALAAAEVDMANADASWASFRTKNPLAVHPPVAASDYYQARARRNALAERIALKFR